MCDPYGNHEAIQNGKTNGRFNDAFLVTRPISIRVNPRNPWLPLAPNRLQYRHEVLQF
jgi:hypothetical protein